ncbi:MAG: NAD(P)-dependent oxidoreductase [Alphaproteobacteria bacterium]|nr:NAD(P)-dependent oxidoreductase [Alphaproteobacteria bacterium]
MSDTNNKSIGWIGTGLMGGPMCRNLLKAGFALSAFNPTISKVAPLEALGAKRCAEVGTLAASAPIVISMITDDKALHAVALGPQGVLANAKPGTVYVDMSTVTPMASAIIAAEASKRGIAYVRAPVSGGVALAEAGKLAVIASGPKDAYERCLPAFAAMSAKQFLLGPNEEARYLKLSLNMLVGATGALLGEALAFGRRGGLDWATMLDVFNQSAIASPLIGYKSGPLKARDFSPTFTSKMMAKDFDLLLATAKETTVPLPLSGLIRQLYATSIAQGRGEDDFIALAAVIEALAGLKPETPTKA